MSEENVEIVRRAFERMNAGDIDGFLRFCEMDLEFRDLPALPGSGVFIGHDAMRGWYAKVEEAFENLRFEIEEYIATTSNHVLMPSRAVGRGRGSGADVELAFSAVATMRNGKLAKLIVYEDHAEALEAAGLEE